MDNYPLRSPKWVGTESSELARLVRERVHAHLRERLASVRDEKWEAIVNERTLDLLSVEAGAAIGQEVTREFMSTSGRLLYTASEVALKERPDLYKFRDSDSSDELVTTPASEGVIGDGENVFTSDDVEGTILVVRHVADVNRLMTDGVPDGTIALIDDAGGTVTAPIFPEFAGALCRAGTVQSHLAIIAREYGVPTLMNVHLYRDLVTGDRVRVRYSSKAELGEAARGGHAAPRAIIEEIQGE